MSNEESAEPAFFATTASSGTFADGTLALEGVDELLLIEDRPSRRVAELGLGGFAGSFDEAFADARPNAVLTYVADGRRDTAVVVIDSFAHDRSDDVVRLGVEPISGGLPAEFADATLTIDDIAAPAQSVTLRNDSAEGVTVALFWPSAAPLSSLVTSSVRLEPGAAREFTGPPAPYGTVASISAVDAWGNWSSWLMAWPGSRFEYVTGHSGDVLRMTSKRGVNGAVVIDNGLLRGNMGATATIWGDRAIVSPLVGPGESLEFPLADGPSVAVSELRVGDPVPATVIEAASGTPAGSSIAIVSGSTATGFRIVVEPTGS